MQNFNIKNNAESSEIDIFGEIGEGWFDEGVTMEGIHNQLNEITSKNITLNISSLGGDVNHAFAIHDLLKMKGATVTANVIGMTASAGTVIAMGADKVHMSENALFLVHNAWTGAQGNAKDMRDTADTLDIIDNRLASIYQKKTGKRKSQILSLMEEEKWITAKEAKDFGFIDKVFEPQAISASVIKNINNTKYLPNLKEMNSEEKTILENLVDSVKNLGKSPDEKLQIKLDEINASIEAKDAELVEFKNKIEEQEVSISENSAIIENHAKDIEAKDAEILELNNKIEELSAKKSGVAPKVDPELEEKELSASAKESLKMIQNIAKDANIKII